MSTSNALDFTVSDLVMGYVRDHSPATAARPGTLTVETVDARVYTAEIGPLTSAEYVRNLGEDYRDAGAALAAGLAPGRLVFVHGTFLPQPTGTRFEAKHVVLPGETDDTLRFEDRTWWVDQIRALADFYLHAEFRDGAVDWSRYRSALTADGELAEEDTHRQECDTISRLVYGFASAYLLTGDERYLHAAETGTEYLRQHFGATDGDTGARYWFHAMDLTADGAKRRLIASEFGDDYHAVPLYEQIYALAGPVQTFRATGDPAVLSDVEASVEFFDTYFLDATAGGYFSHVDPVTFDPRAAALGQDRARKNWNSVGDHAPAYLINVVAATGGERRWTDMLTATADTIVEHFGDYEHSPFVNERFHEDWSHDQSWGWQQNRAVVGHNLKIAWNLSRVQSLAPREAYTAFARRIAEVMPEAGSDLQRGGWYDVVERTKRDGDRFFPFAWHDRKAWWQQEQAILAYLILAGTQSDDGTYLRRAREAAAFYNAFFLDHDAGGVYFNVLADGTPYLMGTERLKGSHSMAGYHSFELCYLAATYTNLLVHGHPLDLHFKPYADTLPDRTLHVAPDLLPPGRVRIARVWIDGEASRSFDADRLTVRIPDGLSRPTVRVELVPVTAATADLRLDVADGVATATLAGTLDDSVLDRLRSVLDGALDGVRDGADRDGADRVGPRAVVVDMSEVESLSPAAARAIAFACQRLGLGTPVRIRGLVPEARRPLDDVELGESVVIE
ncbi:MAG: STAS domain-containing protein [Actinomycetales bacterium]